jgi:hypothetical protein
MARIPVLSRLEQSENFILLSPDQAQSQKTFTTKLVANFRHFPFITHTLKSDKQKRSNDHWNTVHKWKNLGYSFRFGLAMISQTPPIEYGAETGERSSAKVIYNFETFSESTNTPSSD